MHIEPQQEATALFMTTALLMIITIAILYLFIY